MSVAADRARVGMDVWVGIDPDDVQIAVLLERGKHGRARYGVVSPDQKRQRSLPADAVKLLVPVLAVELLIVHHIGSVFANVLEDVVVHVESALVDAWPFLALFAHAENRFKL